MSSLLSLPRVLTVRAARVDSPALSPLQLADRLRSYLPLMLMEGQILNGEQSSLVAAGALLHFAATGEDAVAEWGGDPVALPPGRDPLGQLHALLQSLSFDGQPVADCQRAMLGFLSYDAARGFERLPPRKAGSLPDYLWFLPHMSVLFSGKTATAAVLGQADDPEAERLLAHLLALLNGEAHAESASPEPAGTPLAKPVALNMQHIKSSFSQDEYEAAVRRAREFILSGDIFQVVLSVRWDLPYHDDPLHTYSRLTATNPSPFQYCFLGEEVCVVGASPEPLVMARNRLCTVRPLAGTRRRGHTPEQDHALEVALRTSEKEQAEHRMLVDLARNDLGRVCEKGSVHVDQLMSVERYSHVMHLVSNVMGRLDSQYGLDDLVRAAFPAGTMTGAPKIRAMEIIDELENVARGFYSGGVGLFSTEGLSLFITIRSLIIQGETASLQAGAGIVYDSEPSAEYRECVAKLRAALTALGFTEEGWS